MVLFFNILMGIGVILMGIGIVGALAVSIVGVYCFLVNLVKLMNAATAYYKANTPVKEKANEHH